MPMDEARKAAQRRELGERMRDPEARRILWTTGLSFTGWAIACAFLAYPGEMLLVGYLLTTVLRPLLVGALHRLWRVSSPLRPLLQRLVNDPDERGYTSSGSEPGLGATFLLMAVLLWPLIVLGAWSLQRQPAMSVLVWTLLVVQGLLWRGVFMRFEEPLERNLSYNSLWMVAGILFFLLFGFAAPVVFFAQMFVPETRSVDWWAEAFPIQYGLALLLLAGSHLRALIEDFGRWRNARGSTIR